MRQYVVTNSDVDNFKNIMARVESEMKLKYPDAQFANTELGGLIGHYHYHFTRWIQGILE